MRASAIALALAACAGGTDPAPIVAASCTKAPQAPRDIGIVLLHGKTGRPTAPNLSAVHHALREAGYLVEAPVMPWTLTRIYDKTYGEALGEVDEAVARLRAQGARRIVVAGHSIGGNAAIGYAAARPDVAAAIPIAPGHAPERSGYFQQFVAPDVAKAKSLLAAGQGGKTQTFGDLNQGTTLSVRATPEAYLSFFDPEGAAVIPKNAAQVQPGIAVLWIEGTNDPINTFGPGYAFDKLPAHPKSHFVRASGDHGGVLLSARNIMIAWLNCL